MPVVQLHDRLLIEQFLRKNIPLNIYSIGDLDDFLWPYTIWYGLLEEALLALTLLYTGTDPPTLLSFVQDNIRHAKTMVRSLLPLLPSELYVHISPELLSDFATTYSCSSHGSHYKMILKDRSMVSSIDTSTELLTVGDTSEILALFEESYPDNWFNPRMLETGMYAGIRINGRLVSVAGVHVFSPRYGVAALGNIVTHPELRGRGFGRLVTAAVCREVLQYVQDIGLNVGTDNQAAIACYQAAGFEIAGIYEEYLMKRH